MNIETVLGTRIGLGCWRMHEKTPEQAAAVVQTALDLGIHFFDHADMYGDGVSETRFGEAVRKLGIPRSELILQSKCGIRMNEGYFDFSEEHILEAVDGSLKRLGTDYLDILLLHRPDTLMEPDEVARALEKLHDSGKVRSFGVSNFTPYQIELIERELPFKLLYNQLQFSVVHAFILEQPMTMNTMFPGAIDRTAGILDYCRLKGITIQAWSPLQYGNFKGVFLNQSDKFPELVKVVDAIAEDRGVSPSAVAIAWILRHPAKIMPIIGTMNPARLKEIKAADTVTLSRKEWYEIYRAAGHALSYGFSKNLYPED